jgi:hypothetical protein
MSTIQSQLVCDSSTYANFSQWASAISKAFASFTWTQSTDTGQVMWSGMSISAVSMSGTNATYTYSSLTGLALGVGRALTITGMTNSANNGVKVITTLGTGTFTVVNASGVNESGSTGAVTAQSTVPGSNTYIYEIWQPNDGLTTFYVKVEYGNVGSTNCPNVRLSLGTGSNGSGTLSGLTFGPVSVSNTIWTGASPYTPPSTSIQYECNFSGAAGRFGAMMWRNTTASNGNWMFAIERSINSSGVYTNVYVTLYFGGYSLPVNNSQPSAFGQRSLHLTAGAGPSSSNNSSAGTNGANGGLIVRGWCGGTTSVFNGGIPVDLATPNVGDYDYPGTVVGSAYGADITEGATFPLTVYGATKTYMPSKAQTFTYAGPNNISGYALCLRYD